MALIKSHKGMLPRWGKNCYFSENATIVGDVMVTLPYENPLAFSHCISWLLHCSVVVAPVAGINS